MRPYFGPKPVYQLGPQFGTDDEFLHGLLHSIWVVGGYANRGHIPCVNTKPPPSPAEISLETDSVYAPARDVHYDLILGTEVGVVPLSPQAELVFESSTATTIFRSGMDLIFETARTYSQIPVGESDLILETSATATSKISGTSDVPLETDSSGTDASTAEPELALETDTSY